MTQATPTPTMSVEHMHLSAGFGTARVGGQSHTTDKRPTHGGVAGARLLAGLHEVVGLQGAGGGERPAGAALALVLDRREDPLRGPGPPWPTTWQP